MPAGCYLLGNSGYQRQKRAQAKARGRCTGCQLVPVTRYVKCPQCRAVDAARHRAKRAALREAA